MDCIRKIYGLLLFAAALVAYTMNLTIDIAMSAVLAFAFGRI